MSRGGPASSPAPVKKPEPVANAAATGAAMATKKKSFMRWCL